MTECHTGLIKTGWHLLLTVAALVEFRMAESDGRKLLCGACAGWHGAAAWLDWQDAWSTKG